MSALEKSLGLAQDPVAGLREYSTVHVANTDHPAIVPPSDAQLALLRAFDIALAAVGILVCAVPAVVISIAVKLTSRGPVIFRQDRVGRSGQTFRMWKFRTMRDGTHHEVLGDHLSLKAYAENDFKLPHDDPRITRVGRLLRKTSLDELPQMVNVLRGDMSIVGVRPVEPAQLATWPVDQQALYVTHRPGITGLWQIEGRSTVKRDGRLYLDRQYLEQWSVLGDIKIAARTPLALLRMHHTH